ncbi:MAG TPA: hypothetical protein VMF29_07615 [Candidatus Edwardsbacteria bacterium]|nr:hypothetical protein [Candidatus Edwardsbacteria bacterium]
MKRLLLSFALAALVSRCIAIGPPEAKPVPDKQGVYTFQYLDSDSKEAARQLGMTPAEAAAFKPKLERLAEVFHQNPVVKDPKGIDARVTARIFRPYYWGQRPYDYRYIGEVRVFLEYWFQGKKGLAKQTIEPPQFTALVNEPEVLSHGPYGQAGDDKDKEISEAAAKLRELLAPEKVRELGPGVTLYRTMIVVSDPKIPLYLPVTVGDVFACQLAYWKLMSAKQPLMKVMLDMVEQEYAKLKPGEKEMPAYHAINGAYVSSQPNGEAVVRLNPAYFDSSYPRTAVRLITIPVPDDMDTRKDNDFSNQSACGYLRLYQLARAHDAAALAALIDTK